MQIILGIASPNRRPTIFDVFRPRTKSDAKRKEKDPLKLFGSDKDNISAGSAHGGSGGIMHSVKAAVQNTMGHHKHAGASGTSKYRDGSAHPHAGSDAQVSFRLNYSLDSEFYLQLFS